jgi:hypothetical protein
MKDCKSTRLEQKNKNKKCLTNMAKTCFLLKTSNKTKQELGKETVTKYDEIPNHKNLKEKS